MPRKKKEIEPKICGANQLSERVVARIRELTEEAKMLPDYDDGFSVTNDRYFGALFEFLIVEQLSKNLIAAIEEYHWVGDVTTVYKEINGVKHPIRNYSIRNWVDLHASGPDGTLPVDILQFEGYEKWRKEYGKDSC